MPSPNDLLWAVAVPALVAGLVLRFASRAGDGLPVAARDALGALAIGAGWLLAHYGLAGWPRPPWGPDVLVHTERIAWIVAAAVALAPLRARSTWSNALYVALGCVGIERWLRSAEPAGPAAVLAAFAFVALTWALWHGNERFARARPGATVPSALCAAAAGVSATALANTSLKLALLAAAVSAGLGAAAVASRLANGAHLQRGGVAIAALALAGLVRIAQIYDLPPACAVLLAAAFALPWLVQLPAVERALGPRAAWFAAVALAFVPGAVAAAYAWAAREPGAY